MLLFEILDGMPVELKLLGDVLDRGRPASLPDIVREAFRVERIACQKVQPLAFHLSARFAEDPSGLELEVDPGVATG